MKVAIVGCRDFNDYSQLHYWMDRIRTLFPVDGFVSGGAKGADSLAEVYARDCKIPIEVIKPDWEKFGKAAGMIRNGEIIKAADIIVAFWDGRSRGTKNSIDRAFNAKKTCFVFFNLHTKQSAFVLPKDLSDKLLNKENSSCSPQQSPEGFAKRDSNCPRGLSSQKKPGCGMQGESHGRVTSKD